jgi:hypothetical protein
MIIPLVFFTSVAHRRSGALSYQYTDSGKCNHLISLMFNDYISFHGHRLRLTLAHDRFLRFAALCCGKTLLFSNSAVSDSSSAYLPLTHAHNQAVG